MISHSRVLLILLAVTTIFISLLIESRSLRPFWQTPKKENNNEEENNNNVNESRQRLRNSRRGMLSSFTSRRISIPSNSNSSIVSDIKDIWHAPEKLAICVSIRSDARCPHPALLGRLSGPALALLEWKEEESGENGVFIHCGSYKMQWLEVGTYFLEIIVLFCNDFGINALKREQNDSAWLTYNFQKDCMEDPISNRISGAKSYVVIGKNLTQAPHLAQMGRWVSKNAPSQAKSGPEPLHTRYQPNHCRRNPQLERCAIPMNDTALKAYSFGWYNAVDQKWREIIKMATKANQNNIPKTCLVGFSHSRFLKKSFHAIGMGEHVHHVQARYPSDVSAWTFDHHYTEHRCTRFVIGVAQWPGSLMQGAPYSFDRYSAEMRRIVRVAASFAETTDDEVKVYLRSAHHIPIGDASGACPMRDWRSPVVMDGYTQIIEKAVQEAKGDESISGGEHVEFLDTRFITSPMWDNAFDWIHLPPQVSDVEALFIATVLYNNIWNFMIE